MSEITTYEKTKDSGIEWIGSIPSHWRVHTLYQLVTQVKEKNSNLQEKNLLSLSYGKIKRKDIDSPDGLLPASFDGYNIIENGDIVLRLTDLQNDHTSLRVGLATERGIITSAYTTLRPINTSNSKYLYYLLHAFDLKKGFYGMGSGVRQGLNYAEVKELRMVLPSQDEQDAIASFLDKKCTLIDTIIDAAKVSINEYKKWKSSVIFHCVTKGIASDTTYKDSGIARIGSIPTDWSTIRIKYVVEFEPSCSKPNISPESMVSYAPMECIRTDRRIPRTAPLSNDSSSYSKFNNGDIALAKVTPCFENRNVCIMNNLENGYAFGSSELFNIRAIFINSRFLLYWLQTDEFISGGVASMTGVAGLKRVSPTYVKNALITFPPIAEQERIAAYLDEKCTNINSLIFEKQALIDELEKYKRSLIYEVITGKRKVV